MKTTTTKKRMKEKKLSLFPSCFSLPLGLREKKKSRGRHILHSLPPPLQKKKMTLRPDSAASLDAAGFPGSPLQDATCVREVRV